MSAVKGTAIESVVADVQRLVAEGRVSRDELEARLAREDLELLEQKVVPALWYPIGSYGRFMELLFEREGRRRHEYLIERGRRAAERIRAGGLYAQLKGDWSGWGERIGNVLVTLGPAMYKDTRWRYEWTGDAQGPGFRIEVDVPPAFPDLCRWPTQGFIEHLARLHEKDLRVTSDRSAPTRLVFLGASRPPVPSTKGPGADVKNSEKADAKARPRG